MSSSAQSITGADPFGFGRFVNTPERKVIVLWDYENCPVPKGVSGLSAIRNIREAALKFGSIDQFEAYCDWSNKANNNIKNDLSISGIKLRDCPKKGWIGTVDKTIVVDMMVYALERPRTTTILLISGDRDHAYAISTLRNRGYPVKLLAPTGTLHLGLQVLADLLDWSSTLKSDLPPTELVDFSGLAGGEEEDEEETSEEEDQDDEDGEEEEADETAQVQVEVETEVEEIAQLQVKAGEKAQVLVETDEEADSGEPALPTEPVAILAPAEIPPMWTPAEPALPSKVVPLEPLYALAQEQQEERPQSPRLPSPSPPTRPQTVPFSYVGWNSQPGFGAPSLQQPRTVPSNYGGGSIQPGFGASIIQQPQTVPPSYSGGTSQQGLRPFSIQQPRTVPSNYGGETIQPGFRASSIQQPQTASPSYGGGSSQLGFGAFIVQHPARDIPPKFLALVQELEAIKASGSPPPNWASLGGRVKRRLPSVLSEAGVTKWPEYLFLAEKEGIVELKRRQPDRIGGTKVILRIVPPSYIGGSNQPGIGASSIQQPQTASPSHGGGSSQPRFGASVVQHPARDVPPKFLVLVQELEAIKTTGSPAPKWNQLGKLVKQRLPSVVSGAGVEHWRGYLLLAEKEGIIEIMRHPSKGDKIGKSTISLRI